MKDVSVVLAHGAWADGSSWARVITALKAEAAKVFAAPLPLTSLADDVAALNRSLDRTEGPVLVAGHAYAGAMIALARPERVKALVYITALAPDEGERSQTYFIASHPIPKRQSLPDNDGLVCCLREPSKRRSPRTHPLPSEPCSRPFSGPYR